MNIKKAIEQSGLFCPKRLTLSITTNCNLRCEHCWVECEGEGGQGLYAQTSDIKRLIKEFVVIGGTEICLTGGEPLTHPDFQGILSFCQGMNLQDIHVQTNATLLTEKVFSAMALGDTDKLSFQVSLDGGNAATHDLVRGKGSFQKAVTGITQLVAHGYGNRTTLGFTEMRHNFHDVPELLEFAARVGVASVTGWSMVQHGKAQHTESVAAPLPEQYVQLLELYHVDRDFRDRYDLYGRFAAIEWFKGRAQPSTHTCRFIEKPYVSASGTFYPCVMLQEDVYAAFDIYSRSLDDVIYEKLEAWTELRAKSIKRSKELECLKGCIGAQHCGGGCFARASEGDSSKMCVEDRCQLRRAVYAWHPPH